MTVAEDIRDDATNSTVLQPHLSLHDRFGGVVERLVREVHENNQIRARRDTTEGTSVALRVILANLLRAHQRDSTRYLAMPMSSNDFHRGPMNPLGLSYRPTKRVVDYLCAGSDPYVERRPGGQFRIEGRRVGGFLTRLRATSRLLRLLAGVNSSLSPRREVGDPFDPALAATFVVTDQPIIRLRDTQGVDIYFTDTEETLGMQTRLSTYNAFLDLQWIDLLVPDEELAGQVRRVDAERDEFGERRTKGDVDLFQRRLYRVFNNNSFEQGGRFYGGWWQHIRSEMRRYVTINWAPTVEHDFSNIQAVMLYARENATLEGDAYAIEGIDDTYRPLIKKTFFKLINAEGQIKAPRRDALPAGWTWRELQEAVMDKHRAIARHFRTGVGIRLQRIDADIAEDVMMQFMERDILVLPVHDSFLVYPGQEVELRQAMLDAFRRHVGSDIGIDEGQLFLVHDDPEAMELDTLEVRSIEETIRIREQQDDYAAYRQRKASFLRDKDEAWRWRFYASSA